jgi:hypothetical protein
MSVCVVVDCAHMLADLTLFLVLNALGVSVNLHSEVDVLVVSSEYSLAELIIFVSSSLYGFSKDTQSENTNFTSTGV